VEGGRTYIPVIYCLNKIDQISIEELVVIYKVPHAVPLSAHHKWNFDDLLEKMWEYLALYDPPPSPPPSPLATITLTTCR
jgi:ribosome-interacting GTPase 1